MAEVQSDRSVSIPMANLLAGGIAVAVAVPMVLLYHWVTQESVFSILDGDPGWGTVAVVIAAILAGTLIHEAIHATGFLRIGGASRAAVGMGVHWKMLTPYAWCKEPITAAAYRWVALLPGLILGVFPFVVALVTSSAWMAGWGIFFTLAASGDFLVVWLVRDLPADARIIDHPSRCGCAVVP